MPYSEGQVRVRLARLAPRQHSKGKSLRKRTAAPICADTTLRPASVLDAAGGETQLQCYLRPHQGVPPAPTPILKSLRMRAILSREMLRALSASLSSSDILSDLHELKDAIIRLSSVTRLATTAATRSSPEAPTGAGSPEGAGCTVSRVGCGPVATPSSPDDSPSARGGLLAGFLPPELRAATTGSLLGAATRPGCPEAAGCTVSSGGRGPVATPSSPDDSPSVRGGLPTGFLPPELRAAITFPGAATGAGSPGGDGCAVFCGGRGPVATPSSPDDS